jgi:hypothetical protein
MQRTYVRGIVFIGLAAFVPLVYYLAVVGGLLPYGAILLIAIRNMTNASMLWFSAIHLAIYGVVLYWLAELIARLLMKIAAPHVWLATAAVLLLLAGIGLLPIFGAAHGQIHWANVYALYRSDALR